MNVSIFGKKHHLTQQPLFYNSRWSKMHKVSPGKRTLRLKNLSDDNVEEKN